jgi:Ran GTPase-activating protein (RanGAP) involved in mRNA processing and transport
MLFESPCQVGVQAFLLVHAVREMMRPSGDGVSLENLVVLSTALCTSLANVMLLMYNLKDTCVLAASLEFSFCQAFFDLLCIGFVRRAPLIHSIRWQRRIDFADEGPLTPEHCLRIGQALSSSDGLERVTFAASNALSPEAVAVLVRTLEEPSGIADALDMHVPGCFAYMGGIMTLSSGSTSAPWFRSALSAHGAQVVVANISSLEEGGAVVDAFTAAHSGSGESFPELRVGSASSPDLLRFDKKALTFSPNFPETSWLERCWKLPGLERVNMCSSPAVREKLFERVFVAHIDGVAPPFQLYVEDQLFDPASGDLRRRCLNDADIPGILERMEAGESISVAKNLFTNEGRLKMIAVGKGRVEIEPAEGLKPRMGLNYIRLLDLTDEVKLGIAQSRQILDMIKIRPNLGIKGHIESLGRTCCAEERPRLLRAVMSGFIQEDKRLGGKAVRPELYMFADDHPGLDGMAPSLKGTGLRDEDILWLRVRFQQPGICDITENNFSPEGRGEIFRLAMLPICEAKVIMELADGLGAVPDIKSTTRLDFAAKSMKYLGMSQLAPMLKQLPQMQALELRNNSLGVQGMASLVPALKELKGLKELGLSNNAMGTDGALLLAPALPFLEQLEVLMIDGNAIGREAAPALAEKLTGMVTLKKLTLNANSFWTEGLMELFLVLCDLTQLEHLECDFINKTSAPALAPVLRALKNLKFLEVQACCTYKSGTLTITSAGIEADRIRTVLLVNNVSAIESTVDNVKDCGKLMASVIEKYVKGKQKMTVPKIHVKTKKPKSDALIYQTGQLALGEVCLDAAWLHHCWSIPKLECVRIPQCMKVLEFRSLLMEQLLSKTWSEEDPRPQLIVGSETFDSIAANLQGVGLTDMDVDWLSSRFEVCKVHTRFDLSGNSFTSDMRGELVRLAREAGIIDITLEPAEGLDPVIDLLSVKSLALGAAALGGRPLCQEGAENLAPTLFQLIQLEQLELRDNMIGPEGMAALSPAIVELSKLEHLGLGGSNIGDRGAQAFVPALKGLKNLKSLGLDNNKIGKKGAEALAPGLGKLENLKNLWLINNNVAEEDCDMAFSRMVVKLKQQGCQVDI